MNTQTTVSAAELDKQEYLAARDSNLTELLAYAAKTSGRSVLQVQRDFGQMAKSHSRLNMIEYVRNGLFRKDNFTEDERAAYISNDLHWDLTHKCNDQAWSGTAEDKVLATLLLTAGDVPVPAIEAVLDSSPRIYPNLKKISTAADMRDLVLANRDSGLFGKILDGMVSFGVFRVEQADETHLTCSGHDTMTYEAFMSDFVGSNAYVVQKTLTNHSDLAPYASALATVRMINMVRDDEVFCPQAIIKLPQGNNIADAFWRPGNLACAIDVASGAILTVAERTGAEVTFHEDHPENAGLMGMKLPYWDDLIKINARAAQIFAPIRYQSTDIAITQDGPVVVELNYGGGFDLPQYASGKGMLTPGVRAFFESHGCTFEAPRKKGFFGRRSS